MLARKIKIDAKALGDPDAAVWSGADGASVDLAPTPLALQPSAYLAQTERARPVGRVKQVRVRSLHNGSEIAFHLEWEDSAREDTITDNDAFPDGAALLFPLRKDAPLMTMGSEEKPVAAWHWRADRPATRAATWPRAWAPPDRRRGLDRHRRFLARRPLASGLPAPAARVGRRERSDPDRGRRHAAWWRSPCGREATASAAGSRASRPAGIR